MTPGGYKDEQHLFAARVLLLVCWHQSKNGTEMSESILRIDCPCIDSLIL